MRFYQFILTPFAVLYGIVMLVRNWLFDCGCLPSRGFDVPIISIGNLSCGGTGKTPHAEYLIRLLKSRFLLATLSRGYGRSGKGFILASAKSAYKYTGDEPLQFAKKFADIKVAVDENRIHGIEELQRKFPNLDVLILDDAFQHRYVKPGLSVLLTDFHNLYTDDFVLPSGTLREFSSGARRADILIVTKTPKIFSPITRRRILDELKPLPHQKVFFSYIQYLDPEPLNPDHKSYAPLKCTMILLFSGIANDYPLREYLERHCRTLITMKFPDHHPYSSEDLHLIKSRFDELLSRNKVIFTTEKDMMRLRTPELALFLKRLPVFYLPIEICFHGESGAEFNKIIMEYVLHSKKYHPE